MDFLQGKAAPRIGPPRHRPSPASIAPTFALALCYNITFSSAAVAQRERNVSSVHIGGGKGAMREPLRQRYATIAPPSRHHPNENDSQQTVRRRAAQIC